MKYLITGGCGFVGSNLAAEVLRRGAELFVADITKARNIIGWEPMVSKEDGIGRMLDWLKQ